MGETNGQTSEGPFSEGRILVVAFKGWNDAGEAASTAVRTLAAALDITERHALIDDEVFYDYSISRPHSVRTAAGERRIRWPQVELLAPTTPRHSTEPGDDELDADPASQRFNVDRDSDLVEEPGEVPLFSIADFSDRVAQAQSDDDDEPIDPNLAGDAEMRITAANHDNLLVLTGHEPTLHWRAFCARVLELCEQHGVTRLMLVGALLADVPHSRPIGVFVSTEHKPFRDELGIGRSEYQGPTGVLGALGQIGELHGIPSVSVWASLPHYASQPPSPKAELAVIDKLEELLDVSIPRADLIDRAERWEEEVNAATEEDGEIAEYIDYLERAHDMVEAPEASGEALAKEFERFLRQGDTRGDAGRGAQGQGQGAGPWTGPIHKPGVARAGGEQASPEQADGANVGGESDGGDPAASTPDNSADERSEDERSEEERSEDERSGDETDTTE